MLSSVSSSLGKTSPSGIILGYELQGIIGEGGQGCVRLGIKQKTGESAAIKIIRKRPGSDGAASSVQMWKKEVMVHSSVTPHPNIIQLISAAEDDSFAYIVLELAPAGELFDRISPDIGVPEEVAHFYFKQLISAVAHLHGLGICHRDLKPENLLLDAHGNLKLSDLGLATVFRYKGAERTLTTPCGSPPYVAPEIHSLVYVGPRVDIWSCGIILYVLLAGNTPWAEPTSNDREFVGFLNRYPSQIRSIQPWNGFSTQLCDLILGMLDPNQEARFTIPTILENEWFYIANPLLTDGMCNNPEALAMRLKEGVEQDELYEASQAVAYSQPMDMRMDSSSPQAFINFHAPKDAYISFSQPVVELSSKMSPSFEVTRVISKTVNFVDIFPSERMTRFYCTAAPENIFRRLMETFEQFLVPYKVHQNPAKMTWSTVDKRKCPLHGAISVQTLNNNDMFLVDFKKSKGDPIEFKRFYRAVSDQLSDLIVR